MPRAKKIETKYRKLADLIEAEYNPRELTEAQHQQLTDSIKRFGLVDPVLVNMHPDRENIIVGGHQRCRIAREIGMKEVPVIELHLTLDEEKELNIRLNKNTGQWDWDALANNFDTDDLLEWGFTPFELKFDPEPPEDEESEGGAPAKQAVMKITFTSPEQLQKAENDIQEILDRKYPGAYMSINMGE